MEVEDSGYRVMGMDWGVHDDRRPGQIRCSDSRSETTCCKSGSRECYIFARPMIRVRYLSARLIRWRGTKFLLPRYEGRRVGISEDWTFEKVDWDPAVI